MSAPQNTQRNTPPSANHRPIYQVFEEIHRSWARPFFGAVPYIQAGMQLSAITDRYGYDSADDVIAYFLANAGTWRGDDARRLKAELRAIAAAAGMWGRGRR